MWRLVFLLFFFDAQCGAAKSVEVRSYLDGSELYGSCKDDSQGCIGYVMGVVDTLRLQSAHGLIDMRCMPDRITPQQAILALEKYAREKPSLLSQSAASLVWSAIKSEFCK